MFDLLLKDGLIYDGSGGVPFKGDVAIEGGVISAIGSISGDSSKVEYLEGKALMPGFIDIHGHSELQALVKPDLSPKLLQGFTTELAGNCGVGPAPVHSSNWLDHASSVMGILGTGPKQWNWQSFPEFMDRLESRSLGINLALLVPHGPLREYVLSDPSQAASDEEIRSMCDLLSEAMDRGAFGMSTGLFYDPCCFADRRELLALSETVASTGGLLSVHHRSEGDDILSSLEEVLEIAQSSGVRLEISHLKIGGSRNSGLLGGVMSLIYGARSQGIDVAFDQYPYSAGSTSLYSLLPPKWLARPFYEVSTLLRDKVVREEIAEEMKNPSGWDGIYSLVGWDKIILTGASREENCNYIGLSISEIAGQRGQDPFDSFFDLISCEGKSLTMIDFITSEELVESIMKQDIQVFGTDGLYSSCPHPRTYNSTYRIFDNYVRRGVISASEAVKKLSFASAERIGLHDRGLISPGRVADLVLWDLDSVEDFSTYEDPKRKGRGLISVWIGGEKVVVDGEVRDLAGGLVRRFRR